jgi:hypothetical protein
MTDYPDESSDLDDSTEIEQPISREELNDLTEVLQKLLTQSAPNIDLALQPTTVILEKLVSAQQSLRKEFIQQQETIKNQSEEIEKLKKQSQYQNLWLKAHINWKTIGGFALTLAIALTTLLAIAQKIIPATPDNSITEKIDFLYNQEIKKDSKTKSTR